MSLLSVLPSLAETLGFCGCPVLVLNFNNQVGGRGDVHIASCKAITTVMAFGGEEGSLVYFRREYTAN